MNEKFKILFNYNQKLFKHIYYYLVKKIKYVSDFE